ncbi:hypothetical protein AAFF_G00103170 [Aldrovandia affinis]|uniref:Uncharacterized protein n=1 Tax=Aldrovandia affinis TaxID=143900 RepID=A0AAD7RUL5_9TELE|nr:hypothetical protein AAFF_G00103170 [Aldrovandia affinis]
MFLIGCRNTMEDIESLEEMDNPTNLRTVVSKLPYKMKEHWRAEAYNIKERRDRRAKFADLVSYIEHQAKIATDPLFGDIPDSRPTPAKKEKRGSFATNVSAENQKTKGAREKSTNPNKKGSAFEKPCMYCQQAHTLATCNKIKNQPHKERVEFLKSRGLCFGCLASGHLSKFCRKRTECKECELKHPDILHKDKEDSASQERTTALKKKKKQAHKSPRKQRPPASLGPEKTNVCCQ